MDLHISRMIPRDLPEAVALAHDSGLGGAAPFIAPYLAWAPEGFVLGRDATGAAAACVGSMRYGDVAFIGTMCVASRHQRQGLGGIILQHLMDLLESQGCMGLLLEATDKGAGLYRKLGFVEHHRTHVWQHPGVPTSPHQTVPPPSLGHVQRVGLMDLDAQVFGAPRHRMMDGWLELPGQRCVVTTSNAGVVDGYITAGPGRVGPWVSRDGDVAARLLHQALQFPFVDPPVVFIPEPDALATSLVKDLGFTCVRTLTRMGRGKVPVGEPGALHALATAGLG